MQTTGLSGLIKDIICEFETVATSPLMAMNRYDSDVEDSGFCYLAELACCLYSTITVLLKLPLNESLTWQLSQR